MKAIKYLEELIEQEQDYLCGYEDDEKPQTHIERLKDLRLALAQVKNCALAGVRHIVCPTCKGSGEVQQSDIDWDECIRCDGTGQIMT